MKTVLRSFFKWLKAKTRPAPEQVSYFVGPSSVNTYPYLPNYYYGLSNKAHGGESLRKFFTRLGFANVSFSDQIPHGAGDWLYDNHIECICAILRVSSSINSLDLDVDVVNDLGADVCFVAFTKPRDQFIFNIMFGYR